MGKKTAELTRDGENILLRHTWPGNVRELQNTIERAVILLQDTKLSADDLAFVSGTSSFDEFKSAAPQDGFQIPADGFNLEEHEKGLLLQALQRTKNNKSRAAKLLGLSRATLRYRMEKFSINDDDSSGDSSTD